MMSVVVLMVISSLYLNIIPSLFMIQQTISHVCRRTNNYRVTLLWTSVSSFLLQDSESIHPAKKMTTVYGVLLGQEANQ